MKLSLRCQVQIGLDFFEFLKETDRASITYRNELKVIYNDEFRDRNTWTKDPNFGSVFYALKVYNKVTRIGDTIRFQPRVKALYLDQWHPSRDSAEEPVSGVRARRKLASLLMNRLNTHWAHFISDKHGVSINSDHQFEDGKLCLPVQCTYEYVINLTVKNTGTKPVYFTYYTPLHWLRYFTLKDERKVTKTNPLKLNPGDGYEIRVRFHCSLVGFYPATLAFEFQPDLQSSTAFHIVRFIEFECVTSSSFSKQPSSSPHADHDSTNTCKTCMLFYNTFVAIGPNKCTALERLTLEQSDCQLWHDSRKVRITASTAKKVPIRGNPQNYISEHLNRKFHGNEATQHGIESEALAIQWLEAKGYEVSRRGTVVCAREPWLSASPDGVLNSYELLEIKCPFLKDNESLEDWKMYNMKMVGGMPQLHPNDRHYMQVQLGMFCTGLRACKLLIWTPQQQLLLRVPYNEQFCAENVARLKAFYFKYMLPCVSDEFQGGRLLLSAGYLQFCRE